MLERNTMQYGSDSFEFRRQALLKAHQPLDFTYETSVTNFQISGTEPQGCSRRVIFEIDGKLYRFVNSLLDQYDERGEFDDVLKYGNTVGELLALNADSLASLVGKRVYPWIALDAPADSPVMPSIKIAARVNSFNDVYTKTELSPIYTLKRSGDACKIVGISANKMLNGYGTATVKCKLKNPVTGWCDDWLNLSDAQNCLATALQFQIQYIVTTLDGSDFAQILSVDIIYTTDSEKLSGDTAEIVTLAQEYPYGDLGTCYALIKTGELIDCDLRAFVTFDSPTERRELTLGWGTGEEQTVTLVNDGSVERNIAADTIHLTFDGRPASDFHYDTKSATVTYTAPLGAAVHIRYECGARDDNWREMAADFVSGDEGTYSSRFTFRNNGGNTGSVSAVKFRFEKKSGSVANERLGVGTGKEQIFYLPHHAKAETIQCTGAWKYDEATQILRAVADIDTEISVSYDWIGKVPAVKGYIVGWQPKV